MGGRAEGWQVSDPRSVFVAITIGENKEFHQGILTLSALLAFLQIMLLTTAPACFKDSAHARTHIHKRSPPSAGSGCGQGRARLLWDPEPGVCLARVGSSVTQCKACMVKESHKASLQALLWSLPMDTLPPTQSNLEDCVLETEKHAL